MVLVIVKDGNVDRATRLFTRLVEKDGVVQKAKENKYHKPKSVSKKERMQAARKRQLRQQKNNPMFLKKNSRRRLVVPSVKRKNNKRMQRPRSNNNNIDLRSLDIKTKSDNANK